MTRERLVVLASGLPSNVGSVGLVRRRITRDPYFWVSCVVVVAILVTVLVVVWSSGRWFPAGDMAQAELHMRGFFSHPPLVGAAGRILDDAGVQGSHPGPSPWVALLPVYLLGGRSSAALMAAVVSLHVASIVAALWLTMRRFGRSMTVLVAVIAVAFVRAAGPDFVIEPWNPWLALFPFLVFVLLVDEILHRDVSWRWIVASIVVGSHCVQAHAGYALVVAVAWSAILVVLLRRRAWVGIGGGIGALVVMWVAPVIDQFRREPGNITILVEHFGSPAEPTIALADALRIMATQFNVLGPWILGPGPSQPAETWARWPGFVVAVVLVVVARRRAVKTGDHEIAGLLATLVGGFVVAAISISRLFGPYFEYTIRWVWILSGLSILVSGLAIVRSMRASTTRRMASIGIWTAGLAIFAVVAAIETGVDAKMPGATDSRIVSDLVPQLEENGDRDDVVLLRFYDPYTLDATGFGTLLELERRGWDVRVDPSFAAAALPHRTATDGQVDDVWWVVVGPVNDTLSSDSDVVRLAYVNPRSPQEQIEAERLLDDIESGLVATGRPELVEQLTAPGASLLFAEPPLEPSVAESVRLLYLLGQPVGVYRLPEGVDVDSLR